MMYLLVILVVGSHSESLTTEPFSDKRSCMDAGKTITKWIHDNDARFGNPSRFKCIKVTGT